MKPEILEQIKQDCEKVERDTGHGVVTVKIRNGAIYLIEATCSTLLEQGTLDKSQKK